MHDDDRNAHPPRPQWDQVMAHPLVVTAIGVAQDQPAVTDQGAAAFRESFCAKGLSVDDEGTVYTALTVLLLLRDSLKAVLDSGQITEQAYDATEPAIGMSIVALLAHLPEEVRRA